MGLAQPGPQREIVSQERKREKVGEDREGEERDGEMGGEGRGKEKEKEYGKGRSSS
jgi:hypothetical protein